MSDVYYNYPMMHSIASQVGQSVQVQQALLDAGIANKQQMLAHRQGYSADTFEMCHQKFEQVSHNIIDIGTRGAQAYLNGTEQMQTSEQQQAGAFPG